MINHHDSQDPPPGWSLHRICIFDRDEARVHAVELMLPSEFKAYAAVSICNAERRKDAFDAARKVVAGADSTAGKLAPEEPNHSAFSTPAKRVGNDLNVSVERDKLSVRHDDDWESESDGTGEAYAWDEPLKLIDSTRTFDRELLARNKKIYTLLAEKGNRRKLAGPDSTTWQEGLLALKAEHPNFGEVVNFVGDQIALATHCGKSLRIPPMLLLGPPGIGKTHFSNSLAGFLGTSIERLSFDTDVTSGALLGSDRNWGNTSTGLVFEAICKGSHLNPVVLLDEVDKCREGRQYQSPLASLHSLLEPVSSSKAVDISINFEFDASRVIWIATANDPLAIPASLRSRFTEFMIESPTGEHALLMAQVMLQKTHASMGISGFQEPGREFIRLLAPLTPREQRQALERAYAAAVANGRRYLTQHDLPADVLLNCEDDSAAIGGWLH